MRLAAFRKGSRAASSEAADVSAGRDAALDLVKWMAMATMLLDHLRYLNDAWSGTYVPGRLAFPLFCLAIAANVARDRHGPFPRAAHGRYLGWLLLFALLSEWPYRAYTGFTHPSNVMPALALGLLVAWGAHYRTFFSLLGAAFAVALAGVLGGDHVMYGLPGTLLPAAFLLALRGPLIAWSVPMLLAFLPNFLEMRDGGVLACEPWPVLVLSTAGLAPAFGLWLLGRRPDFPMPPVTRGWGYGFYPGHLTLLYLLRLALFD